MRGSVIPESELPMYSRSYRSWRAALKRLGFETVHEAGLCWMPFSRESNSRLIGPAIALEKLLGLSRLPSLSPWISVVMSKRNEVPAPVVLRSVDNEST